MSHSEPLVSCVIIFLNAEKFLGEAIESVIAQTYSNWELFLIDDGSSDGSTEIAQRFVKKDPRKIHYLEHEAHQNLGVSASRTLGINHARGEFVAFLDADDVWLSHKLAVQIPILQARPDAGMLYGSLFYWYSWTNNPADLQRDYEAEIWNFPDKAVVPSTEFVSLFIQEQLVIPSTTCLVVRREIARQVGGFEAFFRDGFFDDQVFTVKMGLAAPVILLKGYFEKWRRHEESITYISENITGAGARMRVVYLEWVEYYLKKLGYAEPKLWKTLRKALFPYRYPRLFQVYKKLKSIKDNLLFSKK